MEKIETINQIIQKITNRDKDSISHNSVRLSDTQTRYIYNHYSDREGIIIFYRIRGTTALVVVKTQRKVKTLFISVIYYDANSIVKKNSKFVAVGIGSVNNSDFFTVNEILNLKEDYSVENLESELLMSVI